MPTPVDLMERLMARTEFGAPCGCWLWAGSMGNQHYGGMRIGNGYELIHRLSYRLHRGPIPEGLFVLHKCDTPLCVNPDHFFLGTHADNAADKARKGRARNNNPLGEAHWMAKLSAAKVQAIRAAWGAGGVQQRDLAAAYGVNQSLISQIVLRKIWAHVP